MLCCGCNLAIALCAHNTCSAYILHPAYTLPLAFMTHYCPIGPGHRTVVVCVYMRAVCRVTHSPGYSECCISWHHASPQTALSFSSTLLHRRNNSQSWCEPLQITPLALARPLPTSADLLLGPNRACAGHVLSMPVCRQRVASHLSHETDKKVIKAPGRAASHLVVFLASVVWL